MVDGADAAFNPESHARKLVQTTRMCNKLGIPELEMPLARLISRGTGAGRAALAIYFVVGKQKRTAAALLAANTVVIAAVNMPKPGQKELEPNEAEPVTSTSKLRKVLRRAQAHSLIGYGAAFGGLLLATVDRDGKPSLKWKRHYRAQEKELVAAAKEQAVKATLAAHGHAV